MLIYILARKFDSKFNDQRIDEVYLRIKSIRVSRR